MTENLPNQKPEWNRYLKVKNHRSYSIHPSLSQELLQQSSSSLHIERSPKALREKGYSSACLQISQQKTYRQEGAGWDILVLKKKITIWLQKDRDSHVWIEYQKEKNSGASVVAQRVKAQPVNLTLYMDSSSVLAVLSNPAP